MKQRQPKKYARVLGIDDGPHKKKEDDDVLIIGTCMRGGSIFEGVMTTKAAVDGDDSTENIIRMIKGSHFKTLIKCIFIDGIAVAGFNLIDVYKIFEETQIPIIIIMRDYPDINKMKQAMEKAGKDPDIIDRAPQIEKYKDIYMQRVGISLENAKRIINISTNNSQIPECIRISHMIASGIVLGHSKGDA